VAGEKTFWKTSKIGKHDIGTGREIRAYEGTSSMF
jgi:hypothetical protein